MMRLVSFAAVRDLFVFSTRSEGNSAQQDSLVYSSHVCCISFPGNLPGVNVTCEEENGEFREFLVWPVTSNFSFRFHEWNSEQGVQTGRLLKLEL